MQTITIEDSLSAVLREVEVEHVENDDVDLSHNRRAVAKTAIHFRHSRYRFGRALAAYKALIPYAGWMAAVQAIADAIGIGERTIRNILSDHERTLPLAPQVIEALEDAGLDPASKKNSKVISILCDTGSNDDPAMAVVSALRQAARATVSYQIPGTVPISKDERAINKVRVAIRSSLSNIPQNQKLEVLRQAMAEETYALIGTRSSFTITPCEPTLDLMGLKRIGADSIGIDADMIGKDGAA